MESELVKLLVVGLPNFAGFILLAVYLERTIGRTLDLLEKCIDRDGDDDD